MDKLGKNKSDRSLNGMAHYTRQELLREMDKTNRGMPIGRPRPAGAPDPDSIKGRATRRAGKSGR